MVEEARAVRKWWTDLPGVEKWTRAVLGLLVLLYGGVLGFDRVYRVPERVDAHEARIGALEGDVGDLKRDRHKSEYLFCVDLADRGLITKTPQDCYQDYSLRGQR